MNDPARTALVYLFRRSSAGLEVLLLKNRWLVSVLEAVRRVDPPEWVVGAGVIRNVVWDDFHSKVPPTPVRDVDVAFFDPHDLSSEREEQIEKRLGEALPGIVWDIKNQAGVHLWYEKKFGRPIDPLTSIEDAVASWPETATCVAVRLGSDGSPRVWAPYGLTDLLGMRLRRNPRALSPEQFRNRVAEKRIAELWPQVEIIFD